MTRLWSRARSIEVEVVGEAADEPRSFIWQGQRHVIEIIARRWRVDTEWWLRRIRRDYFKAGTNTGLLVEFYHDLETDRWYLQRLYD